MVRKGMSKEEVVDDEEKDEKRLLLLRLRLLDWGLTTVKEGWGGNKGGPWMKDGGTMRRHEDSDEEETKRRSCGTRRRRCRVNAWRRGMREAISMDVGVGAGLGVVRWGRMVMMLAASKVFGRPS